MHGEVFNVSTLCKSIGRIQAPDSFLSKLFNDDYRGWPKAVGFKMMYDQATMRELDPETWGPNIGNRIGDDLDTLKERAARASLDIELAFSQVWKRLQQDKSIRIIDLTRDNQFNADVSMQLALMEDSWVNTKYRTKSLAIDATHLEFWLKRYDKCRAEYASLFRDHNVLELRFEDLSEHYDETVSRVYSFLGLSSPRQLKPPTRRQKTRSNAELITNLDALQRHFRGSKWEPFVR